MIGNHSLVVVTPAGRRRYLEILAEYVLRESDVDRWDLWLNTETGDDIECLNELTARDSRVCIRTHPRVCYPYNFGNIHHFFPLATDANTVYVRLDDDVVFVAPGAIARLARRRLSDPRPFLYFGNILNTALSSFLHQRLGRLPPEPVAGIGCLDKVGWEDGHFAVGLHRRFLDNPDPLPWSLPDWTLVDFQRHSINAISWLGEDAVNWCDRVPVDEEEWLTVTEPERLRRPVAVAGDCFFCHYAFHLQRGFVDAAPDLLPRYRKLAGLQ